MKRSGMLCMRPLMSTFFTLCAFRRPFSRNAQFHRELCRCFCLSCFRPLHASHVSFFRFKETDDLALVFNFAFLVCSNYKFPPPPAQATASVQQHTATQPSHVAHSHAAVCSSTGPPHPPPPPLHLSLSQTPHNHPLPFPHPQRRQPHPAISSLRFATKNSSA